MGRAIFRVVMALIGYMVAVACAVVVITLAEWLRAYPPVEGHPELVVATTAVVMLDGFVLLSLLGTFALVPALVAIVLGEALRLRSWIYYVLAGAAVVGVLSRLLDPVRHQALPTHPQIAMAAGVIGGLAYWLVAGRGAGRRNVPPPVA